MAKKGNNILWLLAGGGLLAWWFFKDKPPAVPGSAAVSPSDANSLPLARGSGVLNTAISPPATTTQPISAPTPAGVMQTTVVNNSIPEPEYSTVYQWASGVGSPPVLAFRDAQVRSEYDGLYTLITQFWTPGVSPTPDWVQFWNNLRAKYDPSHSYW